MIKVDIPGRSGFELKYAVFDFNGTMATDGILDKSCIEKMKLLSEKVDIYILSSDTYGTVQKQCENLPVKVKVMSKENGSIDKMNFVNELGNQNTVCVGNGANDAEMFETAAFSIIIMGDEGCSKKALLYSDVLVRNINNGLDLLLDTNRIIATLRE